MSPKREHISVISETAYRHDCVDLLVTSLTSGPWEAGTAFGAAERQITIEVISKGMDCSQLLQPNKLHFFLDYR